MKNINKLTNLVKEDIKNKNIWKNNIEAVLTDSVYNTIKSSVKDMVKLSENDIATINKYNADINTVKEVVLFKALSCLVCNINTSVEKIKNDLLVELKTICE
ncbi:UNVERIFIED_ORG: hypothetical protein B2H93_04840 [Clostridium botulinum]